MQTANTIIQKKKIDKTTYIVKTFFNGDNSGSVTQKMKTIIENKIVKAPLKDEKQIDATGRICYNFYSASACLTNFSYEIMEVLL